MAHHFATKFDDLTISKGLFRLAAFWFLAVISILYVSDAFALTEDRNPCSVSDEQRKVRLKHAHELLGRYYKKSSAWNGEAIPKINSAVYHWTKEHLPAKYKDQSGKIAQAIIDVSLKEGFDPVFLMSVIEGESSWRPDKIGGVGEVGLMQLRPSTGKWMATRAGVKWQSDKTLLDPVSNIKIGATYLSYLRDRFDDHARLYLAAYNMGQSNVDSALDKKIWPKDYPIHVMKRYVAFYETIGDSKLADKAERIVAKAEHLAAKAEHAVVKAEHSVRVKIAKAIASKKSIATKIARKDKSPKATTDKLSIVMRYTPSPKKKKHAAEIPSKDDDTYFDVDKLVKASDDVNDPKGEQSAESEETDLPAPAATVTAASPLNKS